MGDGESRKKVDNPFSYSSSSSSNSSTITDKSSIEFPKASPPVDAFGVEDEAVEYDPNRIPASIFSGRPSTCCDWSINSNESLFSIRMGNNSFSRDLAFIVYKSGELMRLDDVFSYPTTPLPPLAEAAESKRRQQQEEEELSVGAANSVPAVINKAVGEEEDRNNNKNKKKNKKKKKLENPEDCATSDGSEVSSFAFPILIGGGNRGEVIAELPSSHRVAWKKSLAETQQQPAAAPPGNYYYNAPPPPLRKTPKSSSGGFSSLLSCSCCPFLRN